MESTEQLRRAVFGTMEHPGAVSSGIVLFAFSAFVVVGRILLVALVFGRLGNVFSRAPLDSKPLCRRLCGDRFCLQWTYAQQPGMAGDHRWFGLDAVGSVAHRACVARRGQDSRPGGCYRRGANAFRRCGSCLVDVGIAWRVELV